ncbi:MAG: serine hydrolase domain-containing protein [bacterium]
MKYLILLLILSSCQSDLKKDTDFVVSSDTLAAINDDLDNGLYPNMHSVIICQSGEILLEKYIKGQDYVWGKIDLGIRDHNSNTIHDVRSISKSVVAICFGIAIENGLIQSINQNVFDFFPEYIHYKKGLKEHLTIKHLLTMTDGLDWNESQTPFSGSEIEMEQSLDKVDFILSQDSKYSPGLHWNYNGGSTELLAQIIYRVSGKNIYEFASEHLFNLIGIQQHDWINYHNTVIPAGASGLRLTSRDLLKLGQLILNNGYWEGNLVVSDKWLQQCLSTQILRDEFQEIRAGYGFQFWCWEQAYKDTTIHIAMAHGLGDQKIYIDQENDLLVVVTSGNYYEPEGHFNSLGILNNIYN